MTVKLLNLWNRLPGTGTWNNASGPNLLSLGSIVSLICSCRQSNSTFKEILLFTTQQHFFNSSEICCPNHNCIKPMTENSSILCFYTDSKGLTVRILFIHWVLALQVVLSCLLYRQTTFHAGNCAWIIFLSLTLWTGE